MASASTDITPIISSPVTFTTGSGWAIFITDMRSQINTIASCWYIGNVLGNFIDGSPGDSLGTLDLMSSMTGRPAGIYTLVTGGYLNPGGCFSYGFSPLTEYGLFYWTGSALDSGYNPTNTTTRINQVSPYDMQNVASSTPVTLSASGYINQEFTGDLTGATGDPVDNADSNGIQVKWNVYGADLPNNCIDVICALGNGVGGFNYYSGTGYLIIPTNNFAVSTSTGTILPVGWYTLTTSIIKANTVFGLTGLFGFSFGNTTLVSTSTRFSVGSTTAGQDLVYNLTHPAGGINGQYSTTTEEGVKNSCNPISLGFSIDDCFLYLFQPKMSDFTSTLAFVRDNILTRWPWGYATRIITILTNNASSTASTDLPTYVITFPSTQGASGSPLAGQTLTFNMQEMLTNGSTTLSGIVDPISGKGIKEIIEPWILLFIALSAVIIMFHDIMGMGKHTQNKYANN